MPDVLTIPQRASSAVEAPPHLIGGHLSKPGALCRPSRMPDWSSPPGRRTTARDARLGRKDTEQRGGRAATSWGIATDF